MSQNGVVVEHREYGFRLEKSRAVVVNVRYDAGVYLFATERHQYTLPDGQAVFVAFGDGVGECVVKR